LPPEITPLIVKLVVFAAAILPLVIENLRTLDASNRNNLILLIAGFGMVGTEWALGWSDRSLWAIGAWVAMGIALLLILTFVSGAPGGLVKMMMALLPWLAPTDFFLVFCVGSILVGLIGIASRRDVPAVLPIGLAAIDIWTFGHAAFPIAVAATILLCGFLAFLRRES
jgi:hypothetical protein